jgi:hypothetical protein
MKKTLAALAFAVGLGAIACQSAAALPVAAGVIEQAAATAAAVQPAQYAERHGKGTVTKCYRDFVVGNYACHTYRTR